MTQGLIVGVIEDDAIVRFSTETFLEDAGCIVVSGITGADLAWKISQTGTKPDVLLCDYRLGSETALEAVPRVLEAMQTPQIPVIITTGDSSPEVAQALKACGWSRLLKPYQPKDLWFVLCQIERRSVSGTVSSVA